MLLLLDNYDSFTYNLYDYFVQCGAEVEVIRNDKLDLTSVIARYNGIIISPGPGIPIDAGCTMELIKQFHDKLPILGICLGMQAIGQFFGASLERSEVPMHGKTSVIEYNQTNTIFKNIHPPLTVCRYHSLVLNNISETPLHIIAQTLNNEPMALVHRSLPITGLQFHPEAILTKQGLTLISNWLTHLSLTNTKLDSQ